jgi:phosphomannomutase
MRENVRISVSGIRGEVPEALDVEITAKFASAFASYLEEGGMAFCRDSRATSPMLEMAALGASMASGMDATDFGLLPIPLLQFQMRKKGWAGGIAISGGHNPLPWNAVILLGEEGAFLEVSEGAEVFNIFEAGNFIKKPWNGLGKRIEGEFSMAGYLDALSSLVDREAIQRAGFKVAADPCNGSLAPFLERYAAHWGLTLVSVNDHPDKPFPHTPEPNPENASQVEAVLEATGADLGILFNSDGSRISCVTERGEALSEEFTLPLCLYALEGKINTAVTTQSTSSLTEWAAERAGIRLIKARVGQSAVVNTMIAEGAEAGGEGSGSFVYSPFSYGYDGLLALTLILHAMAVKDKSLSEITAPFPRYVMKKLKIPIPPDKMYRILDRLEEDFEGEKTDFTDGIRIDREGVWAHIRPSTTEFILRVHIEGQEETYVRETADEIRERIGL